MVPEVKTVPGSKLHHVGSLIRRLSGQPLILLLAIARLQLVCQAAFIVVTSEVRTAVDPSSWG